MEETGNSVPCLALAHTCSVPELFITSQLPSKQIFGDYFGAKPGQPKLGAFMYAWMHVCICFMNVLMGICMCLNAFMYFNVHACMHACMCYSSCLSMEYACMRVCVCARVYVSIECGMLWRPLYSVTSDMCALLNNRFFFVFMYRREMRCSIVLACFYEHMVF